MEKNGERVGWQALHLELEKQNEQRDRMEERLIAAFAQGIQGLRADLCAQGDARGKRIEKLEEQVIDLRLSDRKWGGLATLIAAVGTTVAAIWHRS